jgi:acetyl esterase/lipase
MKPLVPTIILLTLASSTFSQSLTRDVPYTPNSTDKLQTLDIYSPKDAKNLPVLFWIHGGGWQSGDKADVKSKPQFFNSRNFVFVSANYRLLPSVDMGSLTRDVASALGYVHSHISSHGGDPTRILVAGHSAGAQLAALLCTDEKYLAEQHVPFTVLKACIPVDGDTYDIPAIIELAETRWRLHHMPPQKFGHREKFGNDPALHRDFSAVYHVAEHKNIPPFLILYVAGHPDTSAQAFRLATVLKEAHIPTSTFAAQETTHNKLNDDLGQPNDPATKALSDFLADSIK